MRHFIVCGSLLLAACIAAAQDKPVAKQASTEPMEGVSGRQTYQQYCASCHGENAKGGGPAAAALKTPPPDLTTLAKQNGGKFPYEYVGGVVRFGKPVSAHGSSDMPVWDRSSILLTITRSPYGNESKIFATIWHLCNRSRAADY